VRRLFPLPHELLDHAAVLLLHPLHGHPASGRGTGGACEPKGDAEGGWRAGGLVREAKDPLTVRSENYTHFGFTAPDRDISVFSARIAGDPKFAGREAFR